MTRDAVVLVRRQLDLLGAVRVRALTMEGQAMFDTEPIGPFLDQPIDIAEASSFLAARSGMSIK